MLAYQTASISPKRFLKSGYIRNNAMATFRDLGIPCADCWVSNWDFFAIIYVIDDTFLIR